MAQHPCPFRFNPKDRFTSSSRLDSKQWITSPSLQIRSRKMTHRSLMSDQSSGSPPQSRQTWIKRNDWAVLADWVQSSGPPLQFLHTYPEKWVKWPSSPSRLGPKQWLTTQVSSDLMQRNDAHPPDWVQTSGSSPQLLHTYQEIWLTGPFRLDSQQWLIAQSLQAWYREIDASIPPDGPEQWLSIPLPSNLYREIIDWSFQIRSRAVAYHSSPFRLTQRKIQRYFQTRSKSHYASSFRIIQGNDTLVLSY